MEVKIDKRLLAQTIFIAYVAICILNTSLLSAFLLVPLALWSNMWLFYQDPPQAVCMISNDKEKCLSIMEDVAEALGCERIVMYEATGEDEYKSLGVLELQDEIEVDLDLDD